MTKAKQALALAVLVIVYAVIQFTGSQEQQPGQAPIDLPAAGESPDALALSMPTGPEAWVGEVVRVSDGDTLVVDVVAAGEAAAVVVGEELKVRLLRIDTPEREREDQPLECWAEEATDALEALAPRGSRVTFVHDQERVDQYGRDLAHAWSETGVWINGSMLADGHATVVTFRPNVAHDNRVRELEQIAMATEAGLWGACTN